MQAGLRLCCSQTPKDRFSRVEAHLKKAFGLLKVSLFLVPCYAVKKVTKLKLCITGGRGSNKEISFL